MEKLLREVFETHYQDVCVYLNSLCRDASLAEDLASETFLEAVKSIHKFRGDADVKTWLFTIARRRWHSYLRRKNRQLQTEALSDFCQSPCGDVEERCENTLLAERIYALLDREPERTRRIVLLRLEGLSFYEIGRQVGISENSARVIDFRAKAKIRNMLKEEGLYDE